MRRGLLAGSFDPFTSGHADLVRRGLQLFDELIIGIGYNKNKPGWIPVPERVRAIQSLYRDYPQIRVLSYTCMTTDFAQQNQVHFLLRGVRNMIDYEYERQIAEMNQFLTGIETIVLFADTRLSSISSSVVRELHHFGKDISEWLPEGLHYQIEEESKNITTSYHPVKHIHKDEENTH